MAKKKREDTEEEKEEKIRLQYNEVTQTVICPNCRETVRVGKGGIANYKSQHAISPKCRSRGEELRRQAASSFKKPEVKKDGSIFSFLKKKPQTGAEATPSQSTNTHRSAKAAQQPLPSPPGPQTTFDTLPDPKNGSLTQPFLSPLRVLVNALPPEPSTTMNIPLDVFLNPERYDDPSIPAGDLWEEVLNKTMKAGLGWGEDIPAEQLRKSGRTRLMPLVDFVEYYVTKRGVDAALFEGKLGHLIEEMELQRPASPVAIAKERAVPLQAPAQPHTLDPLPAPNLNETAPLLISDDEPEPQVVLYKPPQHSKPPRKPCPGYHLPIPEGLSPHDEYPFGLHRTQHLPWNYAVINDQMFLTSKSCEGRPGSSGEPCGHCRELEKAPVVRGIIDRMYNGTHKSTTWAYCGIRLLIDALHAKGDENQFLRFHSLNQARTILRKSETLSTHKRLVVAISQEDIPRVARVVQVALTKRRGVRGILEKVVEAARGVYKVKAFSEKDRDVATLLWRLGGDRVGHIVHRALGLPSVTTLRKGSARQPVHPSAGQPTKAEVTSNTLAVFDGVLDKLQEAPIQHAVLMFDELASEKRVRWNARTNEFVGICREHGESVALEFGNIDDAKELFRALNKHEIHFASEVTMGAVGILCDERRMYSARIVLISGDCKQETGEEHAKVLQVVLDGVNDAKRSTHLRVVSLASDGEARRGSALVQLTFKRKLNPTSPIYPLLSPLRFLNLHVGDDDLTCDKDWKHIIKRFRNLLLRDRGIQIENTRITPAVIKEHLRSSGKSKEHVDSITNPNDLQDVKLAFDLLHDIWNLPSVDTKSAPSMDDANPSEKRPAFQKARQALEILGKVLYHIVYAYVCVDLSLSQQLEHLSAAAHLLFVLYKLAGKDFIPTLLYIDIILMIKNVFFCVAKAKVDTPHTRFFIILLGTDRLEIHFGILRTVVGNDSNLDVLQISERSGGLTDIADILAQRPEWDRGPRRMQLPTLLLGSKEVPRSADHLSPKYLRGDYRVENVTLQTCWRVGRSMAERDYPPAVEILKNAEKNASIEMLAPEGKLLVDIPLGDDDIDESSEDLLLRADQPSATHISEDMSNIISLEDALNETEIDTPQADDSESDITMPKKVVRTVMVGDVAVPKARALADCGRGKTTARSTDRLKRVQDIDRFAVTETADSGLYETEGKLLLIHDPVATLVSSGDGQTWLAIGEVVSIKYDGQVIDRIGHHLLKEKAVRVWVELTGLRNTKDEDGAPIGYDWRTFTTICRVFDVPGKAVETLDPNIVVGQGLTFYCFKSDFLITTTSLLVQRCAPSDLKSLPRLATTIDFPYRDNREQACFLAETASNVPILDRDDASICTACSKSPLLNLKEPSRVLEHVGAHILFDPAIKHSIIEPCGLCLLPGKYCRYFVKKGVGSKASPRVDTKRSSGCARPINFQYARAAVSSNSAPCTNVPMVCPLCPKSEPAVWKYNLRIHLRTSHSTEAEERYRELWELKEDEVNAMEFIWKARNVQKKRRARKSKGMARTLVISAEHTSTSARNTSPQTEPHGDESESESKGSSSGSESGVEDEEDESHSEHEWGEENPELESWQHEERMLEWENDDQRRGDEGPSQENTEESSRSEQGLAQPVDVAVTAIDPLQTPQPNAPSGSQATLPPPPEVAPENDAIDPDAPMGRGQRVRKRKTHWTLRIQQSDVIGGAAKHYIGIGPV